MFAHKSSAVVSKSDPSLVDRVQIRLGDTRQCELYFTVSLRRDAIKRLLAWAKGSWKTCNEDTGDHYSNAVLLDEHYPLFYGTFARPL